MTSKVHYRKRTPVELLTYWLYNTLLFIAYVPAVIRYGLMRQWYLNDALYQRQGQRYGDLGPELKACDYWFHCVSVGEVVAASCVIKALQQRQPEIVIVVTTTTITGASRVNDIFGDSVIQHFLPWDLPWLVSGFIRKITPKKVVITEVELWPNMILQCARAGIPTYVVNARLSERSARRYHKITPLFKPMFDNLHRVCVQGQKDWDAYQLVGLDATRLTLTHNIKFDQVDGIAIPEYISGLRPALEGRFVIVAGSTHEGEESHWLEIMHELNEPNAIVFIVPRHPQRFAHVIDMVKMSDLSYQVWSKMTALAVDTQVVVVDAMGVLTPLYSMANVAFVGGSIAKKGGHNALEPAYFGLPTIMGPHTYNNPGICETLAATGALQITSSEDDTLECVGRCYDAPKQAKLLGEKGYQVLVDNRGALARTLQVVLDEHHIGDNIE